jgi:sugar/nucleoside kinase (ribokinase family)
LTADDVLDLEPEFKRYKGKGIALAAPEVPLDARTALLELGTANRFFRAASFTTAEIERAVEDGLFRMIDLVGLNRDEANMLAGVSADTSEEKLARACVDKLWGINPGIIVSITLGADGSAAAVGGKIEFAPAIQSPGVASTGGSGDAHLAGLVAGLAWGLPLMGESEKRPQYDESPLATAHDLAVLIASMSVVSADTINLEIDRRALLSYAEERGIGLSPWLSDLLKSS